MNNDKLNLDEIFAKARFDEPAMSESEVNQLISEYAKPPVHGFLKKFLTGDKKMISLIGVTAAAIGVIFFNILNFDINQNNLSTTDKHSSKYSFIPNEKSSIEDEKKNIIPSENNKSEVSNVSDVDIASVRSYEIDDEKKTDDTAKKEIIELNSLNHDIKGIKSLKLLPNEIKALGIEVDSKGSYISVLMSKNNPRLRKIYVDWGVGFNDKDPILENPDNYLIPRMITDNRGMRRIEIITDDDTDISIDQMVSTMMTESNNNMMDDILKIWSDKEVWNGSQFNSEKFLDMLSLKFQDNDSTFDKLKFNQDKAQEVIDLLRKLKPDEVKKMFEVKSELQSISKNVNLRINKITNDSTSDNQTKLDATQYMFIMNKNEMPVDSIKNIDKHIKILVDKRETNDDGTIQDDRNFEITFNDGNSGPIQINLPEIDINKLLPVEIPIPNAKDKQGNILKDFSFILWLSLDEETYKLLPERIRNEVKPEFEALNKTDGAVCGNSPNADGENYLDIWRTCSGAIEELNATPNPTDGLVNLSFLLKENRNVSISVNDVFGKKVQDVVVNKRMNKGEILESFQIKSPEAGMYLVVVQTNAGEQAVHRVILSK